LEASRAVSEEEKKALRNKNRTKRRIKARVIWRS
jgi:hypothetical protein